MNPAVSVFLVLVTCFTNGFAEELVIRGYLLTRLECLLRSTGWAILVTTALFASYHVYQGAIGVVGAAAMGLVYAIAFCLGPASGRSALPMPFETCRDDARVRIGESITIVLLTLRVRLNRRNLSRAGA